MKFPGLNLNLFRKEGKTVMEKQKKIVIDGIVNLLEEGRFDSDELGVTTAAYIYDGVIKELENSENLSISEIVSSLRKKALEDYFWDSGDAIKTFILDSMGILGKKVIFEVYWDFGKVKFPLLQEKNYYTKTALFPEFEPEGRYRKGRNSIQHNADSYIEYSIRLIRLALRTERERQFSPAQLFLVDYNAEDQMMTLTELENGVNNIEYKGRKYMITIEDKNNMHDVLLLLAYSVDPKFSSVVQRAFVCIDSYTDKESIFDQTITLESVIERENEKLKNREK